MLHQKYGRVVRSETVHYVFAEESPRERLLRFINPNELNDYVVVYKKNDMLIKNCISFIWPLLWQWILFKQNKIKLQTKFGNQILKEKKMIFLEDLEDQYCQIGVCAR